MSQKRYLRTGSPRDAATLTEFKHERRQDERHQDEHRHGGARRRERQGGYSKKYRKPIAPSKRSAESCAT